MNGEPGYLSIDIVSIGNGIAKTGIPFLGDGSFAGLFMALLFIMSVGFSIFTFILIRFHLKRYAVSRLSAITMEFIYLMVAFVPIVIMLPFLYTTL